MMFGIIFVYGFFSVFIGLFKGGSVAFSDDLFIARIVPPVEVRLAIGLVLAVYYTITWPLHVLWVCIKFTRQCLRARKAQREERLRVAESIAKAAAGGAA
jgi:hypothetical protein